MSDGAGESRWEVVAYFAVGLPVSAWLLAHGSPFLAAIGWGTTAGPLAAALISPVRARLLRRRQARAALGDAAARS